MGSSEESFCVLPDSLVYRLWFYKQKLEQIKIIKEEKQRGETISKGGLVLFTSHPTLAPPFGPNYSHHPQGEFLALRSEIRSSNLELQTAYLKFSSETLVYERMFNSGIEERPQEMEEVSSLPEHGRYYGSAQGRL